MAARCGGAPAAQTARERAEAAPSSAYQIGQMERVLEGAVEHGVTVTRDRLQALAQMPAELLLSDNAHARGFRLEGYGVFFDVDRAVVRDDADWSLRTLDQNDLGLDSALQHAAGRTSRPATPNSSRRCKRIELQVGPARAARAVARQADRGARTVTGSAASADVQPSRAPRAAIRS